MALGTTDIGIGDVLGEMGYTGGTTGPQSLGQLAQANNYNLKSATYFNDGESCALDAGTPVKGPISLGGFRGYDNADLIFRFDPNLAAGTGEIAGGNAYDAQFTGANDCNSVDAPPGTNSATGMIFKGGTSAPSQVTTAAGYDVYDFTGGDFTSSPGTVGDYAYFQSTATSSKLLSQFSSSTTVGTIVFWVYPDTTVSSNVNIIMMDLDDDPSNYPHNNPYSGYDIVIDSTSKIRWVRGDGGGTATANRATFSSNSNVLNIAEWNMVALVMTGANTTATGTTTNYSYFASETNGTISGSASYLSGTAAAVAWEHSATGDQDTMYLSAGNQGNDYFNGKIGHILMFKGALTSTECQRLFDRMKTYYF